MGILCTCKYIPVSRTVLNIRLTLDCSYDAGAFFTHGEQEKSVCQNSKSELAATCNSLQHLDFKANEHTTNKSPFTQTPQRPPTATPPQTH